MGKLDCELRFATVGGRKLTERLTEEFLLKGSTVVAAGDAARIDAMLRDELVKVGDEEGAWTILYRHKTTGTFWELTYPNSQMHGGGPRQLVELSSVMRVLEPDLIADVTFYATEAGGKTQPVFPGYGCPCMVSKVKPWSGWDARLVFEGEPISPGQQRRVGFAFLTPEGAQAIAEAGHFFLWEGCVVGEATVWNADSAGAIR